MVEEGGRGAAGSICMLSVAPMLFDGRIQREARALRDAGWSVRIVYVDDKRFLEGVPDLEQAWASYHEAMHGIVTEGHFLRSREWLWLPHPLRLLLQAVELFLRFTIVALTRRADVYHCHDLLPGVFCAMARRVHGARIVYDAHELEAYSNVRWIRWLQARYERFLIRRSDAVIAVNDEIAEIMRDAYGPLPTVIQNRPHALPLEELDRGRLERELGREDGGPVVIYVGFVIAGERGIEQVIEALSFLDEEVIFVIVGVGRLDEFRLYVEELCRRHGVAAERVRFIGPFPPEEVVHVVSGASVSVALYQRLANVINGVNAPNKLFQSIMARTPVLASDNETLPQYVRHAEEGPIGEVVDESSPREIAARIRELVREDRQREYRANAERMARRVSWDGEAEKLVALYTSLTP